VDVFRRCCVWIETDTVDVWEVLCLGRNLDFGFLGVVSGKRLRLWMFWRCCVWLETETVDVWEVLCLGRE
jgi:hypothetical protein